MVTRKQLLGLAGAALLLPGCSKNDPAAVRIGSDSTGENATVAEIYALTLERAKIPVERHMNIGDPGALMSALERGNIDIYPAYIQTRQGALQNAASDVGMSLDAGSKPEYERRYGVTWLTPSPVGASRSLATSEFIAERYWLLTLTECAGIAAQLRLAATPDFLAAGGMLERLQRFYGGFSFKTILKTAPGEQYDALSRGDADVASAFSTDAEVAEERLIVLRDDKLFWPSYSLAPIVRLASLRAHPRLSAILNSISGDLTTRAIQQMKMHLAFLNIEPRDEARYFLKTHRQTALL